MRTLRRCAGSRQEAADLLGDEGGHVGDLLVAQAISERGHPAAAVLDLLEGVVEVGPRVVEARPGRARRTCLGERVTAAAAGGRVDRLAVGRVAFGGTAA